MAEQKARSFTAKIKAHDGGGAYVEIPFDVEKVFGSKRPKVKATFDGEPYRGTAVRMGTDCHLLIVLKAIREKIGKEAGDKVKVTIEPDTAPRVIKAPKDFAAAMKAELAAAAFWKELSYTHKREYVQWIEEAKKTETRDRRIAKAIVMLAEGKKSR
ncbi:MAG: DUF1905 domain-containing protein [Phycisphaerales bacterium]|nr:DUF1905 domain-containing protein [Phycisphaerales bacterium]